MISQQAISYAFILHYTLYELYTFSQKLKMHKQEYEKFSSAYLIFWVLVCFVLFLFFFFLFFFFSFFFFFFFVLFFFFFFFFFSFFFLFFLAVIQLHLQILLFIFQWYVFFFFFNLMHFFRHSMRGYCSCKTCGVIEKVIKLS